MKGRNLPKDLRRESITMTACSSHLEATVQISAPTIFWKPGTMVWSLVRNGIPRMRTNMNPDVMTSIVEIVITAHVHRLKITG